MKRFYGIGFVVLMCCDTLAQCGIKVASLHAGALSFHLPWVIAMLHQPWLWWALVGYIGAFFAWITLLRHAPVGPAFAASHLEKVSVILVSVMWLGEVLSMIQVAGVVLVLGGIALIGLGETGTEIAKEKDRPVSSRS
ncbi:MAG TPA: EamA family transporter [Thermoanaerobaculia bacterium]|nr:EamA family transporter [Thermoanaerobaculia bacterium]